MPTVETKPPFKFDKALCLKKLDEVGKSVVAYRNRPGFNVDEWLKANVTPLDSRLNVKNEKTQELQEAILALPMQPSLDKPAAPAAKPAVEPKKEVAAPVAPAKK